MQTSHARTIRGLSIAVVILSVLSILGLIFSLAFIGVSGAALGSEEVRGAASYSLSMDPDSVYTMEQLGITEDDAFGMLGFLLGLGAVYVFWGIICSIASSAAEAVSSGASSPPARISRPPARPLSRDQTNARTCRSSCGSDADRR